MLLCNLERVSLIQKDSISRVNWISFKVAADKVCLMNDDVVQFDTCIDRFSIHLAEWAPEQRQLLSKQTNL